MCLTGLLNIALYLAGLPTFFSNWPLCHLFLHGNLQVSLTQLRILLSHNFRSYTSRNCPYGNSHSRTVATSPHSNISLHSTKPFASTYICHIFFHPVHPSDQCSGSSIRPLNFIPICEITLPCPITIICGQQQTINRSCSICDK